MKLFARRLWVIVLFLPLLGTLLLEGLEQPSPRKWIKIQLREFCRVMTIAWKGEDL